MTAVLRKVTIFIVDESGCAFKLTAAILNIY